MLVYLFDIIFRNNLNQTSHVLIWFFIFWGILCLILHLIKVNSKVFTGYAFIFGFIGYPLGIILFWIYGLYNVRFFEPNYTGIAGITYEENSDGDGYSDIEHKSYLYKIDDLQISSEIERLIKIYDGDDNVTTDDFLFWQTGYASGYDPKFIPEFKFYSTIELYSTVGVLTIFEKSLNALMYSLCLMTIPIFALFFGKKVFLSDFKSAVSLFQKSEIRTKNKQF